MIGKRQFSLLYLLSEVSLFALAMGLTRLGFVLGDSEILSNNDALGNTVGFFLAFGTVACWGAAIGGLFGKMIDGIICMFLLAVIAALLMPAVNR